MKMASRSRVWLHFTKKSQSGNDSHVAVCNECAAEIKNTDGNTTNMSKHLKRRHNIDIHSEKEEEPSTSRKKQSYTNQTLTDMWTKIPTTSARHQTISLAIAKYIAIDMRPLDSVNDRGFCELIKTLEPRYNLDSRTYITKTLLPKIYRELKEDIGSKLSTCSFVSLTTDGWTGRNTRSYNTVTAQYLTDEFEFQSHVLCTTEMVESHTAENLLAEFEFVLDDWKLQKSMISVTTDNASNISAAMAKSDVVVHIKCMAHTLNLATQKALQVAAISKLCGKVRRIVTFFRRSTKAANLLRTATVQLELRDLKPVIDVVTRWNSSLDMLERYLYLHPALTVALSNPSVRNQCDVSFTNRELLIAEQLIQVFTTEF